MILRHETTPGYAQLHRRRRRRHRVSGQVLSAALGACLLAGVVLALISRSDAATTMGLGVALLLYALASFGLEPSPHRSGHASRRSAKVVHERRAPRSS